MGEQYEVHWKDYYQILGIRLDADLETIQRVYRDLCRVYHPDRAKDAVDEQRMRDINEAYEVLSDPVRRAKYDELYQTKGKEEEYEKKETDYEETWGGVEYEEAGPIPSLNPDYLDLGMLSLGETRTVTLHAENLNPSSSPKKPVIEYSAGAWLKVYADRDYLPCTLYLEIDTSGLNPGQSYQGEIYLILNGSSTSAFINFELSPTVAEKQTQQKSQESLYEDQKILPWPKWKWQRAALFAAIPIGFFIFAWGTTTHISLALLGAALLAAAIYAGIKTHWLKATGEAPRSARMASGISVALSTATAVGLIIYTAVLIAIALAVMAAIALFIYAWLKEGLKK